MYKTPSHLPQLDAQTADDVLIYRASTPPDAGPWQYRLYAIGPNGPEAAVPERGRFLLVRVDENEAVHEVAGPRTLLHQQWGEQLLDRLWEALDNGELPGEATDVEALAAAEQRIVGEVVSGPEPTDELTTSPARAAASDPSNTSADDQEPSVSDVPQSTGDFAPGDIVWHRSEDSAPDGEDEPLEAVFVRLPDESPDALLVQDPDGDDEPYLIHLDMVVARERPTAQQAPDAVRFRPRGQEDLAPSGRVARIRANIAALRTLHTLRDEQRPATPAEQAVLARWSSWGAVPEIFDPRKREFAGLRSELRSLLSEQEWYAAEATTRNAHFTDAALVEPIWQALKDLGFEEGRLLEPGSGSGNFLAFAPETAQMTGVELDPVTAEIAAALYPDAEVRAESFVDTRYPEGYFDGAVGNVPFDEVALTDPVHNPLRLPTHNHFIVKALEMVRPGGLVAVLTSRFTLDSMGKTSRLEISDRADLVGAVRLPAGAHRKAAGTNAVSDLLILRRRDDHAPNTLPEWLGLAPVQIDAETNVLVNGYFAKHPERVLGTLSLTNTQYGRKDITVHPDADTPLAEALTDVLATITRQARESGLTMSASPDALQRAEVERRAERMRRAQEMFGEELGRFEGTLLDQKDGTFLQLAGGELAGRSVFKNSVEELRSLLGLRDTYVELLSVESSGDDERATTLRQQLNERYDAHVGQYDFLNRRDTRRDRRSAHGCFRTDPYAAGVYALEIYDKEANTAKKSPIFTRAVSTPKSEQHTADTPHDAMAISLNTYGEIRLSEIARLLGIDSLDETRDVLGELVYNEPGSQRLVPAAEYLSGNVRQKIEQVEKILRMVSDESRSQHPFQANRAALRRVLPPDKQPGDIEDIQFGATWVKPKFYELFLRQLMQTRYLTVTRASGADWEVEAPPSVRKSRAATKVYGTAKRNAIDLAQRMLRRASLVVHPPRLDEDASAQDVLDAKRWAAEQTEQTIAKSDEINRLFADWLWQDPERSVECLADYNRLYNSYVPYEGDGSHLTFPGISDVITPRPHQRAGVARALAEPGGSFFDYEVGFGKTLTIAMTLMEMKRLRMVRNPCVVVKNATVNDFRNDFLKAYPGARVLAIDSSEFTKETAAAYVAQIANGDWDAVILPQSLFKRIPMSGRGQEQFVADQTAEYRARIHQVLTGSDEALSAELSPGEDPLVSDALDTVAAHGGTSGTAPSKDTVKKLQGDLKRHTQRAEKNLVKQTMTGISWEQTGIDFIAVDEVQDFANGEVGANNSELALNVSAQAKDLKVKIRTMEKAYGPKVALGSTGTPFPNAMPQAFVMLDYFRRDLLEAAELSAFSSFQAQYLMDRVSPEISPEGIPRMKERIGAFRNAKSFHLLWKTMADVKTKHDIQLPIPKHVSTTEVVDATHADREYMEDIAFRAEIVRAGDVDASVDNLLKISNDGRLAAMDLRMVGQTPDGPGKIDAAADKIFLTYQEYKDRAYTDRDGVPSALPGALQLVFADRGTPSDENRKAGKFIAYDYLKDQLVERGIPAGKIRFAQEAKNAEEKEALWAACRRGQVAVVIGSTDTMGVGVNVQDRAIALHHLDCPWRPSDVTQREGRIVRQFNQHFEQDVPVQIFRWVKEGSFDSFMWQTVERKARFIDQVRTGRDLDEQDRALDGDLGKDYLEFGEIKAIATGNPLLLKMMQAEEEVRQLEAAHTNWKRTNQHLRNVVDTGDETLAKAQENADLVGRAAGARTETKGNFFRMELPNGRIVTKRQDAATALRTRLALMQRQMRGADASSWEHVATLAGQEFWARINAFNDYLDFSIRGLRDIPQSTFTVSDVNAVLNDAKPPLGLITRMENQAEKLDALHATLLAVVDELKQEIGRAQKLVDQPFTKADKLRRARAELIQLEAEIDIQAGAGRGDEAGDDSSSGSSHQDSGAAEADELIQMFQDWGVTPAFVMWRLEANQSSNSSAEDIQRRLVEAAGDALIEEIRQQRRAAQEGGVPDFSALPQSQALLDAATAYLDVLGTVPDDDLQSDALEVTRELIYGVRDYLADAADRSAAHVVRRAAEAGTPHGAEPTPAQTGPEQGPRATDEGPATVGSGPYRRAAEPYADRAEYWTAERSVLDLYRGWAEEFGSRLDDGSPREQALARVARQVLSESQQTRHGRLLGFERFVQWDAGQALVDAARAVADQWDREQHGHLAVSSTWELHAALRDHFARYRATTEDPQSATFLQWARTQEPVSVDTKALEFVPGLSPFGEYTVTGPDGMRTEPASGADLAACVAQLIADNVAVEETDGGLTLTAPNGLRFDISPSAEPVLGQGGADGPGTLPGEEETPAPAALEESGTPLHASAELETGPKLVVQETPGTTLVGARNLAVLLGLYTDPGELVAGRELVRETIVQLQEAAQQQRETVKGKGTAGLVKDVSEASEGLAAAPQVSPAEIFPLYDRLALAASRLADGADGDLAQKAHALVQRTERHLGRLHATGRNLFDVLLDASALDTGSWAVLARNDPLKERPAPYTDSSHLNFARQLIFETYDRWPQVYSSPGGEFSDRLRGAMWEIRQTSDTATGTALPDWMNVVSAALGAAGEADEGVSRNVLRDVAQRSYQHQQSLASFHLAAERSEPYGNERSYTDGADTVTGAWDAWMATRTAEYLVRRETASPSADAPQAHQLSAQNEMREALYAAEWAQTDDDSLDEVTRRSTKAAHAAYALVLSLGEGSYRERDDANVLTRLVRTCYEHAAACRGSAQHPDTVHAVRSQLAERQERLRAVRPDTAQAANRVESSAPHAPTTAVLEIEHHYRGSVVRGTTNEAGDAPVRAALERHGFKHSKDGIFWYLPRRMVLTNRDVHVRKLIDDLTRLGQPHQVITEPPHQEQPETTLPVGEPYASKTEASQDFEEIFGALWRTRETPAGRRLITRGRDARPDGAAVWLAMEELRQGPVGSNRDPFVHPADDVVSRCTALAHAALTLARNLEEERYRAPVALPHFRTMTQYATVLAARVTATSAQEGLWQEVFGTATATPGTDEGTNTPTSDIETTSTPPEKAPEAAGAAQTQIAADLNGAVHVADPLVAGPYGDEELRAAVDYLQHLYQRAAQALPTWHRPDGPPGPSDDVEAWYRGPGKIELPEGFVPFSDDRAVLKVGDVIREGYPRRLDSKMPSYKTTVITGGRDPSDGYYRAAPNTRVHPKEIVAVPTDSRLVTGAEDDRYTIRGTFWDRWRVAEVAGGVNDRGELPLPATIDAYRQAFIATGALARILDDTSAPEEAGILLARLNEATEHHILRLTLTHRVAQENAESEQRQRDQARESQQADEGEQRPATDRAQKRAEIEAMISVSLARQHELARERAVEAALADPYVRSTFDGTSKEGMRPRFSEWLRSASLPDAHGTEGRFREWFHASGPGAENDAAAQVFEQVYAELSAAAEATPVNGSTVAPEPADSPARASTVAQTEPASETEREPEPDPPGKAAEIAATARANGWQVSGGWTDGYYTSSTDYELTLKAQTAHRDRHFVLKWEMKRGRHSFNSQRSTAFHHSDKSAKQGFRPKLADVEREVRGLAIATDPPTEPSANAAPSASAQPQTDQPAALTVERDPLSDAVGDTDLPAATGTPTGIEASTVSSTSMGTGLTEEHLQSLPPESAPRREGDAETPEQGKALQQQFGSLGDRLMVGHVGAGAAAHPSSAPDKQRARASEKPPVDEHISTGAPQQQMPEAPQPSQPARDPQHQEEKSVAVTEMEPPRGPWSSRITIVSDVTGTYVTGTTGAPQENDLRELLKRDKNFKYEKGRWRYNGMRGQREQLLGEVRTFLAARDAQEGAVASAASGKYPPTAQQQAIIDAAAEGKHVAVQALAGTGKTSTLVMIAAQMLERRIGYIAFNRAIADEAGQKFGRNVTARTSHSFALQDLRNTPYRQKVSIAGSRNSGARRPKDVAAALGITAEIRVGDRDGNLQHVGPEEIAKIVMGTLRRYRQSSDVGLGRQHLGEKWAHVAAARTLLGYARRAWADIADPNSNKIFFDHDDYLKIWALSDPRLNFDTIFFDEAQDINPVLRKVIQDQGAQIIVVGDSNQAIYEFRGAVDALRDWPADVILPLTQSWRFGPAVAEVGNDYLALLESDLRLEGAPRLDTVLGTVEEPDAILTFSNVGAISAVFAGFEAGKRVALVGGGRDIEDIARAARDLQQGRRTKHPELSAFENWNEVKEYAESDEDASTLQTFVRLVDRYTPQGLINMLRDLVPEQARDEETRPELVVSTAHKSKGREWDQVQIWSDFPQPKEDTKTGELILPAPDKLRLAYVTVTRARKRLDIGSLGWIHTIGALADTVPTEIAATPAPAQVGPTPVVADETAAPELTLPPVSVESGTPDAVPEEQPEPMVSEASNDEPAASVHQAAAASAEPANPGTTDDTETATWDTARPEETEPGPEWQPEPAAPTREDVGEPLIGANQSSMFASQADDPPADEQTAAPSAQDAEPGIAPLPWDDQKIKKRGTAGIRRGQKNEIPNLARELREALGDNQVRDIWEQDNAWAQFEENLRHTHNDLAQPDSALNTLVTQAAEQLRAQIDQLAVDAFNSFETLIQARADAPDQLTELDTQLAEAHRLPELTDPLVRQALILCLEAVDDIERKARSRKVKAAAARDALEQVMGLAGTSYSPDGQQVWPNVDAALAPVKVQVDRARERIAELSNSTVTDQYARLRALIATHEAQLAAEPQTEDAPAPVTEAAENTGQPPAPAEQEECAPEPLSDRDIAEALGKISMWDFGKMIFEMDQKRRATPQLYEGWISLPSEPGYNEAGNEFASVYSRSGAIEIKVKTSGDAVTTVRAGRLTLAKVLAWLRPALPHERRRLVAAAWRTRNAMSRSEQGFEVIGESGRWKAADNELWRIGVGTRATVIKEALEAHLTGTADERVARIRAAENWEQGQMLPIEFGGMEDSFADIATLERVTALGAVLPDRFKGACRLSELTPGDCITGVSEERLPFIVQERPAVSAETEVFVVGDLVVGPGELRPYTWETGRYADDHVEPLLLPQSLAGLVDLPADAPHPHAPAPAASAAARDALTAPEPVPEAAPPAAESPITAPDSATAPEKAPRADEHQPAVSVPAEATGPAPDATTAPPYLPYENQNDVLDDLYATERTYDAWANSATGWLLLSEARELQEETGVTDANEAARIQTAFRGAILAADTTHSSADDLLSACRDLHTTVVEAGRSLATRTAFASEEDRHLLLAVYTRAQEQLARLEATPDMQALLDSEHDGDRLLSRFKQTRLAERPDAPTGPESAPAQAQESGQEPPSADSAPLREADTATTSTGPEPASSDPAEPESTTVVAELPTAQEESTSESAPTPEPQEAQTSAPAEQNADDFDFFRDVNGDDLVVNGVVYSSAEWEPDPEDGARRSTDSQGDPVSAEELAAMEVDREYEALIEEDRMAAAEAVTGEPEVPGQDDFDRHFEDIVALLRSAEPPAETQTPAPRPRFSAEDEQRLREQYAATRQALSGILTSIDADPILPAAEDPAVEAGDANALEAAMGNAAAEAGAYWGTPEWTTIRSIGQAGQHLREAVREALLTYSETTLRDIRAYGINRTIEARTARAISHGAMHLARRLERSGQRDSRGCRAVWGLHRAAATRADRLTGLLPAGQRIDLSDQLGRAWHWFAERLAARHQDAGNGTGGADQGRVRAMLSSSVESIRGIYGAVSERLGALTQHPVWRRIASLWSGVGDAVNNGWLGVGRFMADRQTLGTGRALWVRTLEIISSGAQALINRLAANGGRNGLRWNVLRVLRHAAEDHIAHLHGHLPADVSTPLGTYESAVGEAAEATPAAGEETAPQAPTPGEPSTAVAESAPVGESLAQDPDRFRAVVLQVAAKEYTLALDLSYDYGISAAEADALLTHMEELGIVGPQGEGGVREVLVTPGDAENLMDASPAPRAPAPGWQPASEPLTPAWFDEVRTAVRRDVQPDRGLSRRDLMSLLNYENARPGNRTDAGRRANESVDLFLQGRGNEVPQHLAGEGFAYVQGETNRDWALREAAPSPAAQTPASGQAQAAGEGEAAEGAQLPRRRRPTPTDGPSRIEQAATGRRRPPSSPEESRRAATANTFKAQAQRMQDRAAFARAAATSPAEERAAGVLQTIAENSRATADKIAGATPAGGSPASPQSGLTAEAFLAALRTTAQARGAQIPDNLLASAMEAAQEAVAAVPQRSTGSAAAPPRRGQAEREQADHRLHGQQNAPSGVGRR